MQAPNDVIPDSFRRRGTGVDNSASGPDGRPEGHFHPQSRLLCKAAPAASWTAGTSRSRGRASTGVTLTKCLRTLTNG